MSAERPNIFSVSVTMASFHPTLDHPNDEDLSLGTPMPHERRRGKDGASFIRYSLFPFLSRLQQNLAGRFARFEINLRLCGFGQGIQKFRAQL